MQANLSLRWTHMSEGTFWLDHLMMLHFPQHQNVMSRTAFDKTNHLRGVFKNYFASAESLM